MRITTRRVLLVALALVCLVLFVLMITDEPAPVHRPEPPSVQSMGKTDALMIKEEA